MGAGNKGKSVVTILTSGSVLAPALAWPRHLFCLVCWAQQQRVLTEEMEPAPHFALLAGHPGEWAGSSSGGASLVQCVSNRGVPL